MYLYRILNRQDDHWTKRTLNALKDLKIGWYNKIINILKLYELSNDFDVIKNMPIAVWKRIVTIATEKKNRNRLLEECYKTENGNKIPKTKTKSIIEKLNTPGYKREPLRVLMSLTKNEGRTLIISRYNMLECGKNFKGTLSDQCNTCNMPDDEEHRLNKCRKHIETNFIDSNAKVPFESVFSNDIPTLRKILPCINQVWNLQSGHGSMR